ncbi:MAG: penicillin-insensitive murein endopeptidase [Myxococcales bacterium]|nr:penicillin-insensitive murein endopeptidase [Myxococcales bacterium]
MRHSGALLVALGLLSGCAPSVGAQPAVPPSAAADEVSASGEVLVEEPATAERAASVEVVEVSAPMADPAEELAVAAELGGENQAVHAHEDHEDTVEDALEEDSLAEVPEGLLSARPGEAAPEEAAPVQSPRLLLSRAEIDRRVVKDLASLGPLSVGVGGKGVLVNGVQMQEGPHWTLNEPSIAYATDETIDFLQRSILAVQKQFPGTPKLQIGHLSAKRGGPLRSHKSHQSGRDVDLGFYYKADSHARWYARAHGGNLDVARTWALVRAFLTETDVNYIFINTSIQVLLKEHAIAIGEDREWLDDVFEYGGKSRWSIIRHSPGHDTHIHVRFYNPVAQEMGWRAYGALVSSGRIKPPTFYTSYKAQKGDILGRVAKRFNVSVADIQKANGLRSTKIVAGRVYRIPRKGQVNQPGRVVIPKRRLPPLGSGSHEVAAPNEH